MSHDSEPPAEAITSEMKAKVQANAGSYANIGVIIRDMDGSGHMGERKHVLPSENVPFKGKEPIGSEISLHIGSQSLRGKKSVHTLNQIDPFERDITVRQTHSEQATTSLTNCGADYINIEIEATQSRDHTYQRTRSSIGKRARSTRGMSQSEASILKTFPDKPLTLPTMQPCKFCAAKRFHHEPPGFCCSKGEVKLVSNAIPDELYDLYTSQSEKSAAFRTYIRTYNNTFAFTSFGVKYDKNLCRRNKGIYTFKIQGQVYHYINEIMPIDNDPSYLQLYFYDMDHEIENRTAQLYFYDMDYDMDHSEEASSSTTTQTTNTFSCTYLLGRGTLPYVHLRT